METNMGLDVKSRVRRPSSLPNEHHYVQAAKARRTQFQRGTLLSNGLLDGVVQFIAATRTRTQPLGFKAMVLTQLYGTKENRSRSPTPKFLYGDDEHGCMSTRLVKNEIWLAEANIHLRFRS
jgi:hypothetical protein